MIRIRTGEGMEFEAETALDAIRALNARALIGEPDAWRFMLRVAARARRVAGCQVRSDDPVTFLRDMSAAGLLEVSGLTGQASDPSSPSQAGSTGSGGERDAG